MFLMPVSFEDAAALALQKYGERAWWALSQRERSAAIYAEMRRLDLEAVPPAPGVGTAARDEAAQEPVISTDPA
ncbi:hypothetical protein [Limobrevibacterium gyesilva]|uniref:Uncharacterized protein n=1 Tax=Limobrevibacterium gyesilva TaxID=2991712 RepID=A0AA41YMZ0_9PROT|nr:hypothetical protein [Limobrevibacterium gyesilva]MCW3475003.1 hypothetical protein [Limobrevibacterium gyesilva]